MTEFSRIQLHLLRAARPTYTGRFLPGLLQTSAPASCGSTMRGIDAFLEMLAAAGVPYLFGNPGTTELPLYDALVADTRLKLILGLHEIPLMGMADGYAMASGKLGVVNVHILRARQRDGDALQRLSRRDAPAAHRRAARPPAEARGADPDRRHGFGGSARGRNRPSKSSIWSICPGAPPGDADGARSPTGPVFLSLPMDLQMEEFNAASLDLSLSDPPDPEFVPAAAAVGRAVAVLLSAKRPGILVGSRVNERGAVAELVAVAERLGARSFPSRVRPWPDRISAAHPLNGQALPHWSPEIRQSLAEFDVLLVVGMDLLREYVYHEPARAIPEHIRLVHLDEDPWQLGKNYPLAASLWGSTRAAWRRSRRSAGGANDGGPSRGCRPAARNLPSGTQRLGRN